MANRSSVAAGPRVPALPPPWSAEFRSDHTARGTKELCISRLLSDHPENEGDDHQEPDHRQDQLLSVKAPGPARRGGLFSHAHGPDDTTTHARYLGPGGLAPGEAYILDTGILPSSEEGNGIHRRDGRTRVLSATAWGSGLWRGGRMAGPANAEAGGVPVASGERRHPRLARNFRPTRPLGRWRRDAGGVWPRRRRSDPDLADRNQRVRGGPDGKVPKHTPTLGRSPTFQERERPGAKTVFGPARSRPAAHGKSALQPRTDGAILCASETCG